MKNFDIFGHVFARFRQLRKMFVLFFLLISPLAFATQTINVYTWANYISDDAVHQFEKETGIEVHVTNYDSNEIMYAKLKADPHIGYDVIIPSSYYVDKMMREDMLHKLDKTQLSNISNLNPTLLNKAFDPHNDYSLPFFWGTTGILVNKKYWDPNTIKHWSDLWQPRFKNQLMMLDDSREVFGIALIKLGYSINTRDPKQIRQAYLLLKKLMPNIKLFNSDAFTNIYIDEDTTVGISWSGETFVATQENPDLQYIYPQEGFPIWIDCAAIPKYAPHLANAEKFINFLMRPDVAKGLMLSEGYASANLTAVKSLPKKLQDNRIMNPSAEILKRAKIQLDTGDAVAIYQKYWQLLKLGSSY